ncbi:MAG: UDP-N-acetylmuramoyl-tripeptide--D-alanyl-D-alanine ligase [Bacteroidales bacterium]|nr:UDP-N-acetylmuramoyl-tripeptide--D-alanyl-D-alanine ligase [Bacteroidales bacterium]MCF8391922.1 UDP-N-acetylmuramoyl-tripeptide--D-alanyl-D-alanine ligase [Bacteroidales bacterium]
MTTDLIYSHFLSSKGITTDTRNAGPGQIYLALKGDHFDGNQFARNAIDKGCTFAIVDDKDVVLSEKYILVENTLNCLQELASVHRRTLNIPVIAITGSNGKTTTKELIASVLQKKYKTHYTTGNLNNHIGVPMTLLRMRDSELAVIEMGANHLGEIAELCEIADPNYGIITNIGKAHLEGFGSFEGVIAAKSELYQYIAKKKGTIFINGENPILVELSNKLNLQTISYFSGNNLQCDGFVGESNSIMKISINFIKGGNWTTDTSLTGKYNLENILAAAAIGKYFGVEEKNIVQAIRDYHPDNNRSQIKITKDNKLLLDAYNANPTSMHGAIMNFSENESPNKMVVIGDMLELGGYSKVEHKNILNLLKELNFNNVFLVGPEFKFWEKEFNFIFFQNTEQLGEHFKLNKVKDHYILIKASRGIHLERLIEFF